MNMVKRLLRHTSVKTTEKYVHTQQNVFNQVENPLDQID